jgi:glucan phosphoethanolaminetransferase (alkaline phosphatase superfamily)
MDPDTFRRFLDTMEPREIRMIMQTQNSESKKRLTKETIYWWGNVFFMLATLTGIFLVFSFFTSNSWTIQILFTVFLVGFISIIVAAIIDSTKKNKQAHQHSL